MNQLLTIIIFFTVTGLFSACEKGYLQENNNSKTGTFPDESNDENEDDDDYVWNTSGAIEIVLNGNSATCNAENRASINGSIVNISSAGTYLISGSLTDGQIIVNTEDEDDIKLVFNGVNITCSNSSPVYIARAKKVIIIQVEESENYLTDGPTYQNLTNDGEPNAALFSKSDLSIYGDGVLIVNGNYADGVASKDGLIIKSGTIVVNAFDDGIRGKDYLIVHEGNITINSGGDGLTSMNQTDSTLGYISIDDGVFDIKSDGDALSARTNITVSDGEFSLTTGGGSDNPAYELSSAKAIKGLIKVEILGGNITINSAEDAIHTKGSCDIIKGNILISSANGGIRATEEVNIKESEVYISKSSKGIESALITIGESTVRIISSHDGFNSTKGAVTESNDNSCLTINSGYVYVSSINGDALDANGNIMINGGSIVSHGPSRPPGAGMDYNGECMVSGGFFVVSGINSNMIQAPSTSSIQYSVLIKFTMDNRANSIVHIEDSNGNSILTFAPERNYQSIIFSSSTLTKGETYNIYTGGSCSGTVTDGLYENGIYSGGIFYDSFTISETVTIIDNAAQTLRPPQNRTFSVH